jgi:hypothetical protein
MRATVPVRRAGALTVVALLALAGCSGTEELAALRTEVAALQKQAQQSADQLALLNLQSVYGYYVDKSQWDDAADLFAKDATLEIAGRGLFAGQDRIRTYLKELGEMQYGRLFNHMQLQPVIHVADDGQSAKARWRSFMQVGHLGQEARWGDAVYENAYTKEDGVWKISKLHSFITFYVEYDRGWNKGAVELPKHLDTLEPDSESTVKYGAFPEVFLPPYHYQNPVSGK